MHTAQQVTVIQAKKVSVDVKLSKTHRYGFRNVRWSNAFNDGKPMVSRDLNKLADSTDTRSEYNEATFQHIWKDHLKAVCDGLPKNRQNAFWKKFTHYRNDAWASKSWRKYLRQQTNQIQYELDRDRLMSEHMD